MIITLKNFIEVAKKLKEGFRIVAHKEGTIDCYLVYARLIPTSGDGSPVSFILTKESTTRFAAKTNPLDASLRGNSNGEYLDCIYHKTLQLLDMLDMDTLNREFLERIEKGYISSFPFLLSLNEFFKDKTAKEQKSFIEAKGLGVVKCPITKEWESSVNGLYATIDGTRKIISRKGHSLVRATNDFYDYEEFEGHSYFWTKGSMTFYTISNIKISLYNIIKSPHIHECPDCGSITYGEEGICQTCYPGVNMESIYQQYSARAERVFSFKSKKEDGKKPLFLGVELELENRTSKNLLRTWKLLKDHAIIKRDGSVSEGIEICTAPATISIHKEAFKEFFEEVKDLKLFAKNNCGMHIHVDRSSLTELQIGKILSFMYNKDNREFLNKIAGRKDNNYCSLEGKKTFTTGVYYEQNDSVSYRQRLRRNSGEGRYTGINLTNNATIEFRIFASTVSYEEFNKNLEFVQSLIDFTKPGAVNVKSLKDFENKEVFLDFVKENKKDYPNLFQFLK